MYRNTSLCTFGQCHEKRICKEHINTVTLTRNLFTYIVIIINVSNKNTVLHKNYNVMNYSEIVLCICVFISTKIFSLLLYFIVKVFLLLYENNIFLFLLH